MKIILTTDEAELNACAEMMFKSEPWTLLGFDHERCRLAMLGEHKEVYVARINDVIAGFVVLQLNGQLRGYIQTICVDPGFRGRQMGTELLRFSEDRILKEFPNVFMCVSSFNKKAQALYARLGFEQVGKLKDHLVQGHDELILRKTTGPLSEFKK